MSSKAVFHLLAVAALLLTARPLYAQSGDALILVIPQNSQIQISATCTGSFTQEEIERDFANLASRLQGRVMRLESRATERAAQGNLSSREKVVTFTAILSAPGLIREGALDLPAFVTAFRRFQQIEILFFVPPINGFRGVRSFENDAVSAKLLEAPSAGSQTLQPYRYRVQLKDLSSPVELPLTEPSPDASVGQAARESSRQPSSSLFFLRLAFVALSAGLAVLLIGLFFVRRR